MSSHRKRKKERQDDEARKAVRRARKKLDREFRDAATRAKYGPSKRSSPVVIKDLETGEVKAVKSNREITGERWPGRLERAAFKGPGKPKM